MCVCVCVCRKKALNPSHTSNANMAHRTRSIKNVDTVYELQIGEFGFHKINLVHNLWKCAHGICLGTTKIGISAFSVTYRPGTIL